MRSKFILSAIVCLFISKSFALGLSEWQNNTPGKNVITHDHWTEVITFSYSTSDRKLDSLNKWFFYKGFVIGEYKEHGYFVINDNKSPSIDTFQTKKEWIKFIESKNLNPTIWTRWINNDWEFSTEELFLYLILDFVAGVFISAFVFLIWYSYKIKKNVSIKKLKKYFSFLFFISTALWVATLVDFIMSKFPQSI